MQWQRSEGGNLQRKLSGMRLYAAGKDGFMIYEILEQSGAVGKEGAIKQADLCHRCGLKSSELKRIVQAERRNGALICSDNRGYYLPAERSETVAFYMATKAAAISRFETLRTFRAALGLPEGQTEMTTDSLEGAANAETEDENC